MMKRLPTSVLILLAAVAYLGISLLITNSYYQLILTLVLVWAAFGLSWNMLSGYTGLVSFGHGAFFGIGAYATVLAQIYFGISPWIMMLVSAFIGALAGLLIGLPTFRLKGHYFALSMLAYPLALLYIFEWLGFQEVTFPMVREGGAWYMQFSNPFFYTLVAMVLLIFFINITRKIEKTRFGMALIAIKQNEEAAEAAGIHTFKWKLKAIALSGAMASAVGSFYSVVLLVVTPDSVFGLLASAQALTVSMFGGVGTVWGPLIGSAILIPLGELLHAKFGAELPGIQGVILGLAIIIVIVMAPDGIFWKAKEYLINKKSNGNSIEDSTSAAKQVDEAELLDESIFSELDIPNNRNISNKEILKVEGLSHSFGGLKAVENVSFSVKKGMILGIIGPNGAGKTTLFNLLNGFIKPDRGHVWVNGVDMIGRKPHVLCAAGVGRTFQVMRPFMHLSVLDNVKVGAYVKASSEEEADEMALEAVNRVGLFDSRDKLASLLTTRELRLMELARAVAGKPEILLLDETLAGLGHGEVGAVVHAIRALSDSGITIVIIEHTMQAMVKLVDEFVVLDHGKVLVVGKPEEITRDKRVVEAYLGKKWSGNNA